MELKLPDANEGTRKGAKFKSHLYGIEIEEEHHGTPSAPGLNRTFMELKWWSSVPGGPRCLGLNRTFMELKWEKMSKYGLYIGLNRTFMELKLQYLTMSPRPADV